MAKVAIVGGGAAGIGAAVALTKAGMEVSLFEAEPRLGGHCFGVSVSLWDQRTIRVDGGVSDFNPAICTRFCGLLHELDLRYSPVNQDVSFMTPDRATVWFSRDGQPQFPPTISNDQRMFLDDIERFNRTCVEVLDERPTPNGRRSAISMRSGIASEFRSLYFEPRAHGDFRCPTSRRINTRSAELVSCWRMQGVGRSR